MPADNGSPDGTTGGHPRAGVVGLGMIGGGVAVSLVRSGRAAVVHDVRPDAADALAGVPAPLASPAEVARRSDVVMVAVVNAAQAREVICGENGLLAAAHPNLTVVLLSTVGLPTVHELAAACEAVGVGFLDCGVTPGDKAAEHGMVAVLGGADVVVERAMPVLRDWAKKVVHCGPSGAGMATKIARNVITYGSWRTVAEASALVEAAGVDVDALATVIESADPKGATLLQLLHMKQDGVSEPLLRQVENLMVKDLAAAQELGAEFGVRTPLVDVARERARQTLGLDEAPVRPLAPLPRDRRERGVEMMKRVYGSELADSIGEPADPFTTDTLDHLFADVWSRSELSVRDRRLLTLGVAASTGRADLIQIQTAGALANEEFTPQQLHEAVLHLALYVGWCNATATYNGVTAALADHTAPDRKSTEQR
ncbi:NAD(P)-binding domain-containing protein [Streptomyces pinistramenti]|uniref:NAD(P)-binding domain-containing protein n=1 Tax=Streptomyces pinistramenti TaxID=2884812 RepID=UPI001D07AC80|nr:NAD(P)-binding domain-containing protein [Streptomyces pinistramenti]MCB5906399.1 NAD(P)-binding domain-containing protein [Streptomyces pinistramenti]